jgi:cytochrome c553
MSGCRNRAAAALGLLAAGVLGGAALNATRAWAVDAAAPAGVANAQRAWQNWTLNCQGCHRPDGSGSPGTAPGIAGTVANFLNVPGGCPACRRRPWPMPNSPNS